MTSVSRRHCLLPIFQLDSRPSPAVYGYTFLLLCERSILYNIEVVSGSARYGARRRRARPIPVSKQRGFRPLRHEAPRKRPPQDRAPGLRPDHQPPQLLLIGGRYPWKTNIVTTIFWVGELASPRNPVPNRTSSWDPNWETSYGGFDNPDANARRNYLPATFIPRQNPFYCALPYNDVTHSTTKPEAPMVIPWFKETYRKIRRKRLPQSLDRHPQPPGPHRLRAMVGLRPLLAPITGSTSSATKCPGRTSTMAPASMSPPPSAISWASPARMSPPGISSISARSPPAPGPITATITISSSITGATLSAWSAGPGAAAAAPRPMVITR